MFLSLNAERCVCVCVGGGGGGGGLVFDNHLNTQVLNHVHNAHL